MASTGPEITFGSYTVFDAGKAVNSTLKGRIEEAVEDVKQCGQAMKNDVFTGPASDIIVENIPVLESVLSTYGVHLMGRLDKKLDKFAANYATADKEASNTVSNV